MRVPSYKSRKAPRQKAAVLFIVGPTASGKSGLAIELAKRLNGEIISADSMLVYKGMDIGTAKPTLKERTLTPHHGIDLVPHTKNFSVFQYREYALKMIREVLSRGRLPIVVGGTGFYIRALLDGLSPQPGANPQIRRKLEQEAKEKGVKALYSRLLKIDRKRALAIGPDNQRRIIRALEIYLVSGRKPSLQGKTSPGLKALGYRPFVIGLNRDREALYHAIGERTDKMFADGLVNEVKQLSKKRFSVTARQGVGYKEVLEGLSSCAFDTLERPGLSKGAPCKDPASPGVNIEQVKERIKQGTRHFAKRQWTWFKKEKGIRWVWWPENVTTGKICEFIAGYFLRQDKEGGWRMEDGAKPNSPSALRHPKDGFYYER